MSKTTINWSAGVIAIACSIGSSYLFGRYVPIKFFSPVTYSLACGAQATLIFILANVIFKNIFQSCEVKEEIDGISRFASDGVKEWKSNHYRGYGSSDPYTD